MKNKLKGTLGISLAATLVLSLIAATFAAPVAADEMEWSKVSTPSWEDEVIAPGTDIFDYAIGSEDGSIVFALGAVVGGHYATSITNALANTCGDNDNAIGLSGSFAVDSGSTITITKISSDVGKIEGDLDGTACYLDGDFTFVMRVYVDVDGSGTENADDFYGEAAVSGEVTYGTTTDNMTFSGKIYRDTGSGTTGDIDDIKGTYTAAGTEVISVDEWQVAAVSVGDLDIRWGMFTEPRAWSSDDGGVTWTDITATVQEASNLPGPYIQFMYGGVDVAPDDEDWLVVAGGIYLPPCNQNITAYPFGTYPDFNGAPAVVASKNGAGNFTYAGDMKDSANGTTMERIYDVAISPEMDAIHNLAIAGYANDGACFSGSTWGAVYRLEAGTWLSGKWDDTSFYDGWDSGVDPTGSPTNCVVAVDFSPNFDLDVTILFMSTAYDPVNPLPYLQSGIWESGGTWNDEADFAPAVQIKEDAEELWCDYGLRMMGLALPADYDGSNPRDRNVYLYVNAYNTVSKTTGSTVVMVEDDSLSPRCGPKGNPLLASIAVHGDADSCKAMVGRYIDWENVSGSDPGDPVPWDCCEGVPVWHTVELDYCCPDWKGACKDPSGPYTALVAYTPDGQKAFAATSGTLDYHWFDFMMWDFDDFSAGLGDESAFSVSLDDGVSFNQLSLIDTDIDIISDVAVCPDCETVYISTINWMDEPCVPAGKQVSSTYETAVCDSVWRSWTKDGGDIGDAWERVYHGDWSNSSDDALLLRLPVDDLEDCCTVYMGIQNSKYLHYTRDCGQCWNTPPTTKIPIQDIAVEAEHIVYVLDSKGFVSKSTQYGRRPGDGVDTKVGSGHSIAVMPDGQVLVGGTSGGKVAYSSDGGKTFSLTQKLPSKASGEVHVIFNHLCEDIVYAALSEGGIYRGYMSDGSWEDLQAFAYGYYGIVLGRSDGTLYAATNNINVDTTTAGVTLCTRFVASGGDEIYSGVARNLTPCETDCCGTEDWDYLISGLGTINDSEPTEWFDAEPSSLRICGCTTIATSSILWAIDAEGYEVSDGSDGTLWTYEDCAAKKGPTLLAPADGKVIACDPCFCHPVPFTFKWERMCLGCSWDIELYDAEENFIQGWYEKRITTDPPQLYVSGAELAMLSECGVTYKWAVRLSDTETDECVHSPWSDIWSFTVAAGAATPLHLLAPENGEMGVPRSNVAFSWSSVANADSYSIVLSPNSDLSGALASAEVTGTAFQYTGTLGYMTPYYWQVTAWKDGTELITSNIGAFTTMAMPVAPPEPPAPPPAPVIEIPPTPMITPNWIYAIIGVGAALIVLIIVLVFRTRRAS